MYVGPDYYLEPCSDTSTQTYDAYFEDQWAYDKILLALARDEIGTSSEVLVGILDSGIDGEHDDLQGRINEALSKDLAYLYGNDDLDDDPLCDDDDMLNHGTKVAGIIAGVCENAQLVSLKIMSGHRATGGNGNAKYRSSYACRAIEHAKANNIMILNMSVGWEGTSINGDFEHEHDYYNVPMASVLDQYDGLLICSAGNNSSNIDDNDAEWDIFPQQYEHANLLVVGASTQNDTKKSNSNWGDTSVDIFAPGENIKTTVKGSGRGTMSDTSAAAPMVAGVAALMLSAVHNLTAADIASILKNPENVDSGDSSAFEGKCVSEGRLNALKAVEAAFASCHHPDEDTYYNRTTSTHKLCCSICDKVISTEAHGFTYTSVDSESHSAYCAECSYSMTEDHNLYMEAVYDGDDGCDVACRDCGYSFHCDCNPEYGGNDETGHYVDCPDGNFSFFEEHTPGRYTETDCTSHLVTCYECGLVYSEAHKFSYSIIFTEAQARAVQLPTKDLYYHLATCNDCGHKCTMSHNWESSGSGYICSDCGQFESFVPGAGVQSLSDEELASYLATLSDEELDAFIASLPEDQLDRVTAILPPENDDELLTE